MSFTLCSTDENQPNEALQSALNWNNRLFDADNEWMSDEFDRLKDLPRANHKNKDNIAVRAALEEHRITTISSQVLAGLVDILYAVCYDARMTHGELNVSR